MNHLDSSPGPLVKRAEQLRDSGDARGALLLLNEELHKAPSLLSARFVRAKCYADLRRFADALADLADVLRAAPEHLKARKLKVEIYLLLNQHETALHELTALVEHFPQDVEAVGALEQLEDFLYGPAAVDKRFIGRASVDHRLHGFQEVAGAMKQAAAAVRHDELDADPNHGDEPAFATKTIAELYIRQGHKRKAIKVLQKIIAQGASDSWAENALASLVRETQLPPGANSAKTALTVKAHKIKALERLLERVRARRRVALLERLDNKHAI